MSSYSTTKSCALKPSMKCERERERERERREREEREKERERERERRVGGERCRSCRNRYPCAQCMGRCTVVCEAGVGGIRCVHNTANTNVS